MNFRHLVILVISAAIVCGTAGLALAQGTSELPAAGLTPGSPFYFLDRWMEHIQMFFTFEKEAKARLEIEFAGERVAEIKVLEQAKGLGDPGITEAEDLLKEHVGDAKTLLDEEKSEGKDVGDLERDLNHDLDFQKEELQNVLEDGAEKNIETDLNRGVEKDLEGIDTLRTTLDE